MDRWNSLEWFGGYVEIDDQRTAQREFKVLDQNKTLMRVDVRGKEHEK